MVEATGRILATKSRKTGIRLWIARLLRQDEYDIGVQWSGGDIVAITDDLLNDADPKFIHWVTPTRLAVCQYRLQLIEHELFSNVWFFSREK